MCQMTEWVILYKTKRFFGAVHRKVIFSESSIDAIQHLLDIHPTAIVLSCVEKRITHDRLTMLQTGKNA